MTIPTPQQLLLKDADKLKAVDTARVSRILTVALNKLQLNRESNRQFMRIYELTETEFPVVKLQLEQAGYHNVSLEPTRDVQYASRMHPKSSISISFCLVGHPGNPPHKP